MPTQRMHGGAPIFPIPLVAPGFYGLNKQEESAILGAQWATKLTNAVVDDTGRLGARKGFQSITTAPVAEQIVQTFEYVKSSGTVEQISSTDSNIYSGTKTPSSIKGSLTITDGNWQFMNFNETCVGIQEGEAPITYTDGGAFAPIVAIDGGSVPSGGVGLSAFGRLWIATAGGNAIRYCDILDETIWDDRDDITELGDSGTIDMTHLWPKGIDTITAIVAHNSQLVIFGREQIVIFGNATSSIGVSPSTSDFLLVDTISSVGCVSRDTIQTVRGDLWFLSEYGVISLGRLIQEKSAPMATVSTQIQDYMVRFITDATSTDNLEALRSCYSPKDRLYLLSFPNQSTAFAFDTRGLTERGQARVSTWTIAPTALSHRRTEDMLFAIKGATGELGKYAGYYDNTESYVLEYESGWLELDKEIAAYLKLLKRIKSVLQSSSALNVVYKWWWDFSAISKNYPVILVPDSQDEWGSMEWNDGSVSPGGSGGKIYDFLASGVATEFDFLVSGTPATMDFIGPGGTTDPEIVEDDEYEWSGGSSLKSINVPGSGSGQYLKVGVTVTISGSAFGLQQLDIISKIGRHS